jgi:hypothetical protein
MLCIHETRNNDIVPVKLRGPSQRETTGITLMITMLIASQSENKGVILC